MNAIAPTSHSHPPARGRIAFVGAGHVGATAAYAMMLRALFEEIVLIDRDDGLSQAEAADLGDANAMARPARIWAGTYDDAASAQIAVLTAGAASHGNETRLSLASRSAVIVAECTKGLADAGFKGVLIVASNPVDLMTVVAARNAGLPRSRVFGTGTLLDSARLKQILAGQLGIAPAAIEGYVLGEHGDSEIAAFSTVRIGGQPMAAFADESAAADLRAVAETVRTSAYRIISGKGYTSFAIATAIVRICEAVARDERMVLPVSTWPVNTWLDGRHGFADICLSLPCVVGAAGIERVLLPMLDQAEEAALLASAAMLRDALMQLDLAA